MTMTHAAVKLRDICRTPTDVTISRAVPMLSRKVGIVTSLTFGLRFANDPSVVSVGASLTDLEPFFQISNSNKAGGAGLEVNTAIAAAFGEAMERYCMYFYDKRRMILASYKSVQNDACCPDLLRLYSEPQTRHPQLSSRLDFFNDDSVIRWVPAFSLTSSKQRLVPASLVYLNYGYNEDEAAIGRNATSGLAAAATIEEAVLSGILEIIERDAFTISWLHRYGGRRLPSHGQSQVNSELIADLKVEDGSSRIGIYDLSLDIAVPTVFCFLMRRSEIGPILSVGAATRTMEDAAITKSLLETAQGLAYLRFLKTQFAAWEPLQDHSDLTNFDAHFAFYLHKPEAREDALAHYLQLSEPPAKPPVPTPHTNLGVKDEIDLCINILADLGYEVVVVDVTTPDIASLGFSVVRVLVPGLVPLHANHNFPYLGVARLHKIRQQMNWPESASLNKWPHPFP